MVYLSKIYTRTGDDGSTGLGDGTRVPKNAVRIDAYGTVDELGATLGLLLAHCAEFEDRERIEAITNDLFDLGADLCVPLPTSDHGPAGSSQADSALRIVDSQIERLEEAIDRLNATLEPLRSFVLPGGTVAAAWCHLARTVCRRAERQVVALAQSEPINPRTTIYLNRLSDYLFVLARVLNRENGDRLWQPGQNR